MTNTTNTTAGAYKPESIFQRRLKNFKKIKRAYYSLLLIGILYLLSFLAPLLINGRALIVRYNGETYFPAMGDLFGGVFPTAHREASYFGQTHVFGVEQHGEANYRELKKQFAAEGKGNWVLMPPYPYSPIENLLGQLDGKPPTKPDSKHILGTDNRGRDVFARIAYGFQISISFAALVTILSYILSVVIGGLLGYFGGRVDIYGLRLIEIFSNIPFLFMVMILVSFLKPSFTLLVVLLVILGGWIGMSYLVRGEFYREKARDYVSAAHALGASDTSIMFKHILPNALTPIITYAPFSMIGNISALVGLDFLGFGLRPPTPSWGELINQGLSEDISYWWLIISPLFMMFFTLNTITFIGEGVRQAFDPRDYSKIE